MASLLASQVKVIEANPGRRGFDPVQTDVLGVVGVTERGPIGEAVRVTSFDEFRSIFGGFIATSELPQTLFSFFLAGGQIAEVVRVVHVTDVTDPTTATSAAATLDLETAASAPTAATITGAEVEPFALTAGAVIAIDVDGGGPANATFDAAAASRTSTNTEAFVLADSQTLTLSVNGGPVQTVTFLTAEFADIALATAAEVAAVINAQATGVQATTSAGAVVVTTDRLGTGASLDITGGTANAALGFTTGAIAGTGDVADITAVTAAEIKTVVEADVAGLTVTALGGGNVQIASDTTGPTSTLQIASGSVQIALGVTTATVSGTTGAAVATLTVDAKTDGSFGNDLQVLVAAATSGVATEFNLSVIDDGVAVPGEVFPNLTMDATADRYVETVVNGAAGSNLIAVTDLLASVANPRPANGTFGPLTGGDDGLAGLVDADFIGGKSDSGRTGFRVLDAEPQVSMMAVPGRTSSTLQNAAVTYCEVTREGALIYIADVPAGLSASEAVTHFQTTTGLVGLSEFVVAYWPQVVISNPDTAVFGSAAGLTVPYSGVVAGQYAKVSNARPGGVFDPPAGNNPNGILSGVIGVADRRVEDLENRDLLSPLGINPINITPGGATYLDGTKTLRADSNFPRIPHRRGTIFIQQTVKLGVDPYRHQPNTATLRNKIKKDVEQFLLSQMKVGAFASNDPSEAFVVDFSEGINPANLVEAGELHGKVGLAYATPADFIIIEFSRHVSDALAASLI